MKITDLSNLSSSELKEVIRQAKSLISAKEAAEQREAMNAVKAFAKEQGLKWEEVVTQTKGKKRGPVAPKYRNPKDPSLTWTGRGRQPIWVRDHVESGKSIKKLLIK